MACACLLCVGCGVAGWNMTGLLWFGMGFGTLLGREGTPVGGCGSGAAPGSSGLTRFAGVLGWVWWLGGVRGVVVC